MTNYYVRTNGADGTGGHDGTTPALAWLTLGYAMTHVSAGDTIYVGAGTYRVSGTIAPSSMASMTYLYGDVDGSKTGDAGEVVVTSFTSDTAAAATVSVFTFNSKNYWTLGKLSIVSGGSANNGIQIQGGSHDLVFQDLAVTAASTCISFDTLTFGVAINATVERCRLYTVAAAGVAFYGPNSASGANTNANVLIRNCLIMADIGVQAYTASPLTYKTGGVTIANCTILCGEYAIQSLSGIDTTYKFSVYNSLCFGGSSGLVSDATNTFTEDYNFIHARTLRTNVTAGANSISNLSRNFHFRFGQEAIYGAQLRPLGTWPAGSPMLAWGTSGSVTVTDDIDGNPRPGSGAASVTKELGAVVRGNSGTRETSTVHAGANALKISGPGFHDFALPVAAAATTVTVYVQWDATYAGTKPSMSLRNGGECGVADASDTATGSSGAWEQLSIGPFTPTATGFVTIRLTSSDTNGGGAAFFDDFAVS